MFPDFASDYTRYEGKSDGATKSTTLNSENLVNHKPCPGRGFIAGSLQVLLPEQ